MKRLLTQPETDGDIEAVWREWTVYEEANSASNRNHLDTCNPRAYLQSGEGKMQRVSILQRDDLNEG